MKELREVTANHPWYATNPLLLLLLGPESELGDIDLIRLGGIDVVLAGT
jgi:hypothetical protein